MRKSRLGVITMVALLALFVGLMPASAGQPGTGTTTIYVQNADSDEDAQIVAAFFNQDGSQAGDDVNLAVVPPYTGKVINIADAPPSLPPTWSGSLVVSSDRQVAVVGRTIYEDVPDSGDGITAGDYAGLAEPADTSFLAYVFDSANRNSIITVQNTQSSEATVYLHYFIRAGALAGEEIPGSAECSGTPIVDTIPANGVVYYDLLNQTRNGAADGGAGGTIPCMGEDGATTPAAGSLGGFEGAVYITSTNQIAVANSTHWRYYEGVYTGATADDSKLLFPQVVRQKSPGADPNRWNRWSAIIVQNTKDFPVDITVSLFGENGNNVSFTDTVPPLSSKGYNTRYKGDFRDGPGELWEGCVSNEGGKEPGCTLEQEFGGEADQGWNWVGAATVEVNTPGGRIVGVGHIFYHFQYGFSYEALLPGTASNTVVCPVLWDREGTNDRYSAALIQNASPTVTATVDLYLWDMDKGSGGVGNADLALASGYQIPPGGRLGANTKYSTPFIDESVFGALGGDWEGTLVAISRDESILGAVTSFRLDQSEPNQFWTTTYDCFNVQ